MRNTLSETIGYWRDAGINFTDTSNLISNCLAAGYNEMISRHGVPLHRIPGMECKVKRLPTARGGVWGGDLSPDQDPVRGRCAVCPVEHEDINATGKLAYVNVFFVSLRLENGCSARVIQPDGADIGRISYLNRQAVRGRVRV